MTNPSYPTPPLNDPLASGRTWAHVMYALHSIAVIGGLLASATFILFAFLFSWTSILAVVLNYIRQDRVRGTWLESHYRWQLRTFWFAVLWLLIATSLLITVIGIPLAFIIYSLTGLWVIYRIARGWMALVDRSPMPIPPL